MTSGIESNAGCAGVEFARELVPLTAWVGADMFACGMSTQLRVVSLLLTIFVVARTKLFRKGQS
jgi:hypothetical protein